MVRNRRLMKANWKAIGPFTSRKKADKPKEPAAKIKTTTSSTGKPTIANAPSTSTVARISPAEAFLITRSTSSRFNRDFGSHHSSASWRGVSGVTGSAARRRRFENSAHASAHGIMIKKAPMRVYIDGTPQEKNNPNSEPEPVEAHYSSPTPRTRNPTPTTKRIGKRIFMSKSIKSFFRLGPFPRISRK